MIIQLLIVLVIVGVILYLLNVLVPMDDRIKKAINVIALLLVFLYILQAFGLFHGMPSLR